MNEQWKQDLPAFKEATELFYKGEKSVAEYKGFSGYYGSYAQKGAKASMLRLRMTAGVITKEKLNFIVEAVKKHNVDKVHFTTCEAVQLHNLNKDAVCDIMEKAMDVDIVTIGGGGDFPRNVMCSSLSGLDPEEYFDVMPYAKKAAEFLLPFVKKEKMPRKLKVCFSSSPKNVPHATFRDLGFVAKEDGKFDVYSAGGLGNNAKFGVKVAEAIEPNQICYYIKAMWLTFITYGDYKNRGRARTRYMQEICGGIEEYKKAYNEKLQEVFDSNEDLTISVEPTVITKQGDGTISGSRIFAQKQDGLYAVFYHPIGGNPDIDVLCALNETIKDMEAVEVRLLADEGCYIVNLTASEAQKVLDVTTDHAKSVFETSVSCIGASICQVGLRDSQGLLHALIDAVRQADIKDGALPQIHISGCPSSCGTHQIGVMGFRGANKIIDKKAYPAFLLYVGGCDKQGEEKMGKELGAILTERIPDFIVELGKAVEASNQSFDDWFTLEKVEEIAAPYIK